VCPLSRMQGTVLQVNISPGGLPKYPIQEAIVTPFGIEGDSCAHPEVHGGPEKALLIVCSEVIEELTERGHPLFPGALGENLTIAGLDRRQLRLGQQFRVGGAFIELTRVRRPCSSLDAIGPGLQTELFDAAVKAGDTRSPRWGMSGFYARVLRPGTVRPNDIIQLVGQVV